MEVIEEIKNEQYDDSYELTLKDIIGNLLLFPDMINNNYIKEQLLKYSR